MLEVMGCPEPTDTECVPTRSDLVVALKSRAFLLGAGAVGSLAVAGGVAGSILLRDDRPVALVYRGPASSPGCPEAVARLVESGPNPLRAVYCGPGEDVGISPETLATAAVYAQPGGGELAPAWEHMRQHAGVLRDWIGGGGGYLGFCLGGYLAGATPGFTLLPGDTARYIASRDSTVDTTANSIVSVRWRGVDRRMFFQDGPVFRLEAGAPASVLARYPNGEVAAVVTEFGAGRVGVVGPHPEADNSWYTNGLVNPDGIRFDLGYDLVDAVMTDRSAPTPTG